MPMTCGDGEGAEEIVEAGRFGRDEIRQTTIGAARRFAILLTQMMQRGQHLAARGIGVQLDIVVVDLIGREQADDRARLSASLRR